MKLAGIRIKVFWGTMPHSTDPTKNIYDTALATTPTGLSSENLGVTSFKRVLAPAKAATDQIST